jgi:hypothetical protein
VNFLPALRALGAGGVAEGIGLGVDLAPEVFEDVVRHLGKDIDNFRIKLAARPSLDFLTSFAESSGGTIGTVGDDGVEGIGDGEYAGA